MKGIMQDRPYAELVFSRDAVDFLLVVLHSVEESSARYDPGNCFLLPSMGSLIALSENQNCHSIRR